MDIFDEDDDEDEDNLDHCIYRVKHMFLVGNGQRVEAENDFILVEDKLLLVLQWMERPEGTMWPSITLELDEDMLEEDPDRPGKFLYSGDLRDPREEG